MNFCLAVATRRVQDYSDESDRLATDPVRAMECFDCEELLQSGIAAYHWIRKAEEFLREADYQGTFEFTPEVRQAVDAQYASWLRPCPAAEEWVARLATNGQVPGNLGEFREICELVQDILVRRDWIKGGEATRALA